MVKNRVIILHGYEEEDFHAFLLNDDSAVSVPDRCVDIFIETDLEICAALGCIVKESKSFFSDVGFVFCEIYLFEGEADKKLSYLFREFNLGLIAVNICHAKRLFNSA